MKLFSCVQFKGIFVFCLFHLVIDIVSTNSPRESHLYCIVFAFDLSLLVLCLTSIHRGWYQIRAQTWQHLQKLFFQSCSASSHYSSNSGNMLTSKAARRGSGRAGAWAGGGRAEGVRAEGFRTFCISLFYTFPRTRKTTAHFKLCRSNSPKSFHWDNN